MRILLCHRASDRTCAVCAFTVFGAATASLPWLRPVLQESHERAAAQVAAREARLEARMAELEELDGARRGLDEVAVTGRSRLLLVAGPRELGGSWYPHVRFFPKPKSAICPVRHYKDASRTVLGLCLGPSSSLQFENDSDPAK